MKPVPVLFVTWLLAGLGAVAGSILGNALGGSGLYAGAALGGVLAIVLANRISVGFGWLPRRRRLTALLASLAGFGVAVPLAVTNLHTPVAPILLTGLTGAGAVIGGGIARRRAARRRYEPVDGG